MRIGCKVFALLLSIAIGTANGQTASSTALPEAPVAQAPATTSDTEGRNVSHLKDPEPAVGDSLYAPLATGNGPQSLSKKTRSYVVATFGPRAFVSPAFSAAMKMARPPSGYPREWIDGGPAFGREYGAALGTRVAQQTGRYAAGALLHEDFRYRPSGKQGVARLFYALGYTFADRTDSGHRTLAVANFAGAAASGFVGNLYLPDGFNSPGDGAVRFEGRFVGYAGNNVSREFAPEIRRVTRKLHLPFPRVPSREWWTKSHSASKSALPADASTKPMTTPSTSTTSSQ
ncbi:MAG: hypothetical protein P4K80_09500 [Acidobacteriaceae bacterium]|nr:hypothetical protein [Acidobacteriaceae bacterium]